MIVFVLFAYVLELFFIDVAQECIESLAKPTRAVVRVVFVVQSQLLSLKKYFMDSPSTTVSYLLCISKPVDTKF